MVPAIPLETSGGVLSTADWVVQWRDSPHLLCNDGDDDDDDAECEYVVDLCGIIDSAKIVVLYHTHTHTHPFNDPLSWITQVSQCQKGKTNLDFTEARDSEWQWHQLGHMQVCTLLQTDNYASNPPLSFSQAGCPFCRPANSVKALKAITFVSVYWNKC